MNYKLLFTVATLSLSTLAASDASKTRPADNSHMGAEGYFRSTQVVETMEGEMYTLCSKNALTLNVHNFSPKKPFSNYLQTCLKDDANKSIFNNAKAFGIFIYGYNEFYVVLNNGKTYTFVPKQTDTKPFGERPSYDSEESNLIYSYYIITKGNRWNTFGYTSNQELIQRVFASIGETGKITPDLIEELNTPAAAERAETLAAVASAVVATRADSGMSAGAGAPAGGGSGSASTTTPGLES
jgi:hypothetical protein